MPEVLFIARSNQTSSLSSESRVDFLDTNLNLLAHAQAIELHIGSRCGGHGVCGGDRVRVLDLLDRKKLSPLTEKEREHLSESEISDGFRLACQCYPDDDSGLDRLRIEYGY